MSGATSKCNMPTGREIQITQKQADGKLVLDQEALDATFCHPSIGKRPILVVAIVGAFRKGKSFLLNFFLRYLRKRGYENKNWMGGPKDIVDDGFTWRGGQDGVTYGITIWSEPFIMKRQDTEIALLLMDTQGAFDNETSFSECVQIFTTCLLMSSLVIYNLQAQIQEDNLQYLEYFMTYSRLLQKRKDKKPKQKLMFLIRDWVHGSEYGLKGGEQHLKKVTSRRESIGSKILSAFEKRPHCFLLPLPGKKVMQPKNNIVRLEDIEKDFLHQVEVLASTIFGPTSKMLEKNDTEGKTLINVIIDCWNTFEKLPSPETINELASRNLAMASLSDAEEEYNAAVDEMLKKNITIDEFISQSAQAQEKATKSYLKQISKCVDIDVQSGTLTLRAKLKQQHERYVLLFRMNQMQCSKEEMNCIEEFENKYLDDMEEILCDNGSAVGKLANLHALRKKNKTDLKMRFSKLQEEKIEDIGSDMEKCFDLFKNRIALQKRFESVRKTQDNVNKIKNHLQKMNQNFNCFVEELQIDAQLEQEFKKGVMMNIANYDKSVFDPIIAKINMALFEERKVTELQDTLKGMKDIYVKEITAEKTFYDMKWNFLHDYVEEAKTNKHEVDLQIPQHFIDNYFEPEFDLARRINAKNEKYVNWSFQMDLLRVKLEYTEVMHGIIDKTYVKPEELDMKHEELVSKLCEKWEDLHEEESDVTGSIKKHVDIIKTNLSDMYEEFKEWNEKNKSFYKRVAGGITGIFATGAGVGVGGTTAVLVAEFSIGATISIIGGATAGAAVIAGIAVGGLAALLAHRQLRKKQKEHMETKQLKLHEEKKKLIDYS